MSTPANQSTLADRPLSQAEVLACGALLALGVLLAAGFEVYDSRSPGLRVSLTALAAAVSFALAWLALAAMRLPASKRSAGAAWATLPSCLLLSQLAYVGTWLVPLEIITSALLLRFRTRIGMGAALLIAGLVRGVVLLGIVALRRLF